MWEEGTAAAVLNFVIEPAHGLLAWWGNGKQIVGWFEADLQQLWPLTYELSTMTLRDVKSIDFKASSTTTV